MPSVLQEMLIYLLIPIIATVAGGAVAMVYSPGAMLRSVVQHFTAGLIFAAVATELLPDLLARHAIYAMLVGFTLGVAGMLGITWYTEHKGQKGMSKAKQPMSLVLIAAVNFLIDGLLIGIGFVLGGKTGVLLTIALALESLFLSLTVSTALHAARFSATKSIAIAAGFGVLLALGAVVGATLLAGVSGRILAIVIAFGAAALLYLVAEELLVEAEEHRIPENALTAAMFFVGFLLLLIIEMNV